MHVSWPAVHSAGKEEKTVRYIFFFNRFVSGVLNLADNNLNVRTMTEGANSTMKDNELWSLLCSMLVFLMFLGLLMIEAGCVRSKNVASVFFRGLASLTISLVTSWICGFMFAHSSGHYLIGYDSNFATLHQVQEVKQS